MQQTSATSPAPGKFEFWAFECPQCRGWTVHVSENQNVPIIAYPHVHGRPPCPSEVPADLACDYDEACAVLPFSPQSSAALARRILQALLQGPGQIPKGNLADQIDQATAIPSHITEGLHLLRQMGNFAAHEQRDKSTGVVLPIERHEAEFVLGIVEMLFDHYFVAPQKLQAMKERFNQEKMSPAGKKPVS